MLLPSIVLVFIFVYVFIGQTAYSSLTDANAVQQLGRQPANFVGFQQYNALFTNPLDYRFRMDLVNTVFFTVLFIAMCLVAAAVRSGRTRGMALAALMCAMALAACCLCVCSAYILQQMPRLEQSRWIRSRAAARQKNSPTPQQIHTPTRLFIARSSTAGHDYDVLRGKVRENSLLCTVEEADALC